MRTLASLTLLPAIACATTTQIVTEPPGATVLDEQQKELGKTPYRHESTMWIWDKERVTVKAPGKKSTVIELKRSEVSWFPMICGGGLALTCCVGMPIGIPGVLWVAADGMKLPETTKVGLDDDPGAGAAAAPVEGGGDTGVPH